MIGLYFSSTGNTKYVVDRFIKAYDESGKCYFIEEKHIATILKEQNEIVLTYPVISAIYQRLSEISLITTAKFGKGRSIYFCGFCLCFNVEKQQEMAKYIDN